MRWGKKLGDEGTIKMEIKETVQDVAEDYGKGGLYSTLCVGSISNDLSLTEHYTNKSKTIMRHIQE